MPAEGKNECGREEGREREGGQKKGRGGGERKKERY